MADDIGAAGRAERPPLSRQTIVDATLRSMDERGIAVTSLRSVAADLGVEPMTLYHYVKNRDDLFDAVVERIVEELDDDPEVQQEALYGWQHYLMALAAGVRRYARAHPHAFPLVSTRPPEAPWLNPPLRSLRWIERVLATLRGEGFTDDEVLFSYRRFNSFLLGFLLLETSAMTLADPKPGDGALAAEPDPSVATATSAARLHDPDQGSDEAADPATAVPGGLSPTRSPRQRRAVERASDHDQLVDPVGAVDAEQYPVIHSLAAGLGEDRWSDEFALGLHELIDSIEIYRRHGG